MRRIVNRGLSAVVANQCDLAKVVTVFPWPPVTMLVFCVCLGDNM